MGPYDTSKYDFNRFYGIDPDRERFARQKRAAQMMRQNADPSAPPVVESNRPAAGSGGQAGPSPVELLEGEGRQFSGADMELEMQREMAKQLMTSKLGAEGMTVGPSQSYVSSGWGGAIGNLAQKAAGAYLYHQIGKKAKELDKEKDKTGQATALRKAREADRGYRIGEEGNTIQRESIKSRAQTAADDRAAIAEQNELDRKADAAEAAAKLEAEKEADRLKIQKEWKNVTFTDGTTGTASLRVGEDGTTYWAKRDANGNETEREIQTIHADKTDPQGSVDSKQEVWINPAGDKIVLEFINGVAHYADTKEKANLQELTDNGFTERGQPVVSPETQRMINELHTENDADGKLIHDVTLLQEELAKEGKVLADDGTGPWWLRGDSALFGVARRVYDVFQEQGDMEYKTSKANQIMADEIRNNAGLSQTEKEILRQLLATGNMPFTSADVFGKWLMESKQTAINSINNRLKLADENVGKTYINRLKGRYKGFDDSILVESDDPDVDARNIRIALETPPGKKTEEQWKITVDNFLESNPSREAAIEQIRAWAAAGGDLSDELTDKIIRRFVQSGQ